MVNFTKYSRIADYTFFKSKGKFCEENEKERNKMQIKNKICRKSRLKLSRRKECGKIF